MIDNFSILVSTLMVMYIVWRAAKMDRVRPWFETRSLYEQAEPREAAARARRRSKRPAAANHACRSNYSRTGPRTGASRPDATEEEHRWDCAISTLR